MRLILTVSLCALTLSACMANWPSHRTGPRWTGGPADHGPADAPFYQGGATAVSPTSHDGPNGPQP